MNIFIVGATGRMGQEIQNLIKKSAKLKFVGGLSSQKGDGLVAALNKAPKKIDVVIDFSNAEIFSDTVKWCAQNKLPLLSGTTGIGAKDKKEIETAGKKIPILWAPNTAPGVHWVKKIFTELGVPDNFDVQLVETHHTQKKDKPSGTALLLQEALTQKTKKISDPIAIRGGGVFGIHRIELMAQDEIITIEHQALSRTLFARGALDAALWLKKQKAGVYTMENFITGK